MEDKRIQRVMAMERLLEQVEQGVDTERHTAKEALAILLEYYESPLWREDFEADEAGLLPKNLKRGVLGEDTIYNLIS